MIQIVGDHHSNVRAEAMADESVLRALWNEVDRRNKDRIAHALKEGGKDRETLEKEFPTLSFEEILKRAQQEVE